MHGAAFDITHRFGSFTLGPCIGSGGNASVFAARQTTAFGASRLVALKRLHVAAGTPSIRDTFQREVSVALRLEHPGIVRTYEVGEIDGALFMAMELVVGATLDRIALPLPAPIATRIVADVARALAYAHETCGTNGAALGLVHQDVTPQNVIVGRDGRVRLLDFGVARLSLIDASRTDTVRGKPAYLSPEQIEGEHIDRRTDLFALGVVAWELLTGIRLFKRETIAATYHAILSEPVADLRTLRPDLPVHVADAVARALRKNHETRWESGDAFADALGQGASDADFTAWARGVTAAVDYERALDVAGIPTQATPLEPTIAPLLDPTIAPVEDDAPIELPKHARWPLALALAVLLAVGGGLVARRAFSPAPATVSPSVPASAAPTLATGAAPTIVLPTVSVSAAPPPPPTPPSPRRPASKPVASPVPITRIEPAPSAPTTVDVKGYVSVQSNVWGHVEMDGRAIGDSPLARVPVSPGRHTLRIVTERGEQSRAVDVGADENRKERFVF